MSEGTTAPRGATVEAKYVQPSLVKPMDMDGGTGVLLALNPYSVLIEDEDVRAAVNDGRMSECYFLFAPDRAAALYEMIGRALQTQPEPALHVVEAAEEPAAEEPKPALTIVD